MDLKSMIRNIPDFPKKGILFRDISPLLLNPEAVDFIARHLASETQLEKIDHFAGIESRGFILAGILASYHKKGFIPIRKAGKLPPPVVDQKYTLEYGEAVLEMGKNQSGRRDRVMVVDDVLATGGTLEAALQLCERAGYEVGGVAVLVNLRFLNQMTFQNRPICSLLTYEG